jgi:altronate dehydratase small subunit
MKPALVISDRDNVATALEPLEAGRSIEVGGCTVIVREPIPPGHKLALADIAAGDEVVKYGSAIGRATADILRGAHVHTHNLSSGRGRGDLEPHAVPLPRGARLAEPEEDDDSRAVIEPVGGPHD